ncbi:MAG: sulfurtransferase TusA family protein [Treponema sp.]|jgi:TusA-related sulfurtransferase|nr:sulfurtransferase TusA family protein [Treponema sp.]
MKGENIVDARGLSCPEPVLLTKKALAVYGNAAFCVEVSSAAARDNVAQFLAERGRSAQTAEADGLWRVNVEEG